MAKRRQFNPITLQSIRAVARRALAKMMATGRCPDCGTPVRNVGSHMDCPHCNGVKVLRAQAGVVANVEV